VDATAPDGTRLWWDISGQGSATVLLPGRGDSTDIYPARFREPLLAAGHRVVRYDPRDTGLSEDGPDGYTMANMADDVLAVLDAAGLEAAHLVGLSMGGLLIVDLACRAPERVLSLTFLSAASPDPDAGVGDDFFDLMDDDPTGTIIRAMGATTDEDRAWVALQVAEAELRAPSRPDAGQRHQDAAYRSVWPSLDQLAEISAPCLAIHGTADRKLPIRHGEAFARGIPACELVVMDGMGHIPRPHEWDAIAALVAEHIG
jgi:3-oxoadipate enol-lactonase